MDSNYTQIQSLIQERADCQARMNLLSCTGTPEIKDRNGKPFLYIRKREAGKQTSTYVGAYNDTTYRLLLRDAQEARVLRKRFKRESQYPSRKFLCVYSDELIEPQGEGKGSLVHITAIFGFMLASLVIQDSVK